MAIRPGVMQTMDRLGLECHRSPLEDRKNETGGRRPRKQGFFRRWQATKACDGMAMEQSQTALWILLRHQLSCQHDRGCQVLFDLLISPSAKYGFAIIRQDRKLETRDRRPQSPDSHRAGDHSVFGNGPNAPKLSCCPDISSAIRERFLLS